MDRDDFKVGERWRVATHEFVESCGEKNRGRLMAFGLADAHGIRYAVVAALHDVKKCDNTSPGRHLIVKILIYAFSGNQLIDTPVSQSLVNMKTKRGFFLLDKIIMSFCFVLAHGRPPQELRDLELDYEEVLSWEKI